MEVAGLEPEPEPHEFLSAALGLKPKKKVGAEQSLPVELATPVDPTPIAEVATIDSDPFARLKRPLKNQPSKPESNEDDELVSVADLGDDSDDSKLKLTPTKKQIKNPAVEREKSTRCEEDRSRQERVPKPKVEVKAKAKDTAQPVQTCRSV